MRIYNSDGSEPEMCGNGIRCLARFVAEKDNAGPRQYKVSTGAGQPGKQILTRTLPRVELKAACMLDLCCNISVGCWNTAECAKQLAPASMGYSMDDVQD